MLLCCLASVAGRAEQPPRWGAPDGCPERAAFDALIADFGAGSGSAFRSEQGTPPHFDVHIERGDGDYLGVIRWSPEGAGGREVRGETCDAVVAALALVASMLTQAEPAVLDSAPVAPELAPAPLLPAPPAAAQAQRLPAHELRPRPHRARWALGAGPSLRIAQAPAVVFAGEASLEFAATDGIRPWLRVGALAGSTAQAAVDRVDARFSLWSARAQVAPARLRIGPLDLWPSAGMEAGQSRANALAGELDHSYVVRRPWLALLQVVHGRVALARGFAAVVELGLFEPLRRVNYVLHSPYAVAYRTPALGAHMGFQVVYVLGEKSSADRTFGDRSALSRPTKR